MKKNKVGKIEKIIGIIPAKKMRKKNTEVVRPFWQALVKIFFSFCEEKFGEKPSFDGSAPKDMGFIVDAIKSKAEEKGLEWSEEMAKKSWLLFLQTCHDDKWLFENFLLSNMNRQKDRIFFKLKKDVNGKQPANLKTRVQAEFNRRYGSGK